MSKKERWIFLQKFGRLLDASLSVEEALCIAAKNIRNKRFVKILQVIRMEVTSGKSVSDAFSTEARFWGQSTLALILVGEISGTLASNLLRASENMRSQAERRGKMLSALFYPSIISILALAIIVFLLVFVYPKITPLFSGMKVGLPISTRMIMKGSFVLSNYWIWFLTAPFVLVGVLFYLAIEFIKVRLLLERLVITLPVVGNIIVLNQLCDTSFVIGSLCQGGMNVTDAIATAEESVTFISIRNNFSEIHREVTSGSTLSESVSRRSIFPETWSDLIVVGERTGSLSSSLLNISELHRQDIDEIMTTLNKLIEPVMMILVGGVVGFIALSIITPMYSLTQHVQGS
ncbi:MAG: type II secretion system F family protein [Patescibacteria group bacterium]